MRIIGYAAIFDWVDRSGDIIRPGAFTRSLQRGPSSVAFLYQHSPGQNVGRIDGIEEDHLGLRISATIRDTHWGSVAKALVRGGLNGLSFGYRVRQATGLNPRQLIELDLVEISLVSEPMQSLARLNGFEEAAA